MSCLAFSRALHLGIGALIDGWMSLHEIEGYEHSTLPLLAGRVYTRPLPDSSRLLSFCLALQNFSAPFHFCMGCSSEFRAEFLHYTRPACLLWRDSVLWFLALESAR